MTPRWPCFLTDQNQFQTNYTYRENCPESHIFPPILTIFDLVHDINKTNILIKFHDREKIHVRKTAPPPGGHVFQPTRTIFELKKRRINSVEFHEDRTEMRSLVFTRQKFTTDTGRSNITTSTYVIM
ncbi:hypothetical protein DPMN_133666 [Dreissena polymorpha]|uniref:Uncharacterized protein n=1 Tax=Dreissena polymorpha TaxID=45954 RepID=A0A9D4FYB9_DREPO|nr:hypothetical protein DPMN_133666 [Dreissena polymorpha]